MSLGTRKNNKYLLLAEKKKKNRLGSHVETTIRMNISVELPSLVQHFFERFSEVLSIILKNHLLFNYYWKDFSSKILTFNLKHKTNMINVKKYKSLLLTALFNTQFDCFVLSLNTSKSKTKVFASHL